MPNPFAARVIESMCQPLMLQKLVTFGMQEQWFAAFEFSVLFAEDIKIDGSPEASSLAANDDDRRRVDGEEDAGSATAVPTVLHGFTRSN